MCDETLRVRTSTIEIALLTKFLHQELSDLYPDEPESVLVISRVVLAKVIGEGGFEPSRLVEIPGLEGIDPSSLETERLLDRLKRDGWIRQKSENSMLIPGDLFRAEGNTTIDHLNRMINQVYKSLHRNGDRPEDLKGTLAVDKFMKKIWDKESAENDSLSDL